MRETMSKLLPESRTSQTPFKPTTGNVAENKKSYVTPEGFERSESTFVHPRTLEDMSNYTGPVLPLVFNDAHGQAHELPIQDMGEWRATDERKDAAADARRVSSQQLTEKLQDNAGPIPDQFVPPRNASIQRKPVGNSSPTSPVSPKRNSGPTSSSHFL